MLHLVHSILLKRIARSRAALLVSGVRPCRKDSPYTVFFAGLSCSSCSCYGMSRQGQARANSPFPSAPDRCLGQEKVRRIRLRYNAGKYDILVAYGDSGADLPMLELARPENRFYKPFRYPAIFVILRFITLSPGWISRLIHELSGH